MAYKPLFFYVHEDELFMPADELLLVKGQTPVDWLEVSRDIRSLLVESSHVTMPTERWVVGKAVIDTYVQEATHATWALHLSNKSTYLTSR